MKKILIIIFSLFFFITESQELNRKNIYGYFWVAGGFTYYVIDSSKITQISVCDICESILLFDTTTYTFQNDTLTFNFGEFKNSSDYYEHNWLYIDSLKRFVDIEFGEYVRVSKETINRLLKPFGLQLVNKSFQKKE